MKKILPLFLLAAVLTAAFLLPHLAVRSRMDSAAAVSYTQIVDAGLNPTAQELTPVQKMQIIVDDNVVMAFDYNEPGMKDEIYQQFFDELDSLALCGAISESMRIDLMESGGVSIVHVYYLEPESGTFLSLYRANGGDGLFSALMDGESGKILELKFVAGEQSYWEETETFWGEKDVDAKGDIPVRLAGWMTYLGVEGTNATDYSGDTFAYTFRFTDSDGNSVCFVQEFLPIEGIISCAPIGELRDDASAETKDLRAE